MTYAHIQVGATDVKRLVAFYDVLLPRLGWVRGVEPDEAGPAGVFWRPSGPRRPPVVVRKTFDGRPATVGNGSQVSFLADSKDTVDALWADAIRAGGTDEGRPGLRPQYASDFYAAYCRDPEGHKLCFVYTSSETG